MGRRGRNATPTAPTERAFDPGASERIGWHAPAIERGGKRTRADAVMLFLQSLRITSGNHAGEFLRLRPWQIEACQRLYATDATGHRPVRTAVVSMGRKGGKTTFAAGLALAHLCGPESVRRGQVVSAAADRGQAAILWKEIRAFAMADRKLAARLVFREMPKDCIDDVTGSTFQALSADHRKAHGLSPTFAVCDEVSVWRGRELLEAIRTGQGAHTEPLLLAISTRSPDPANPLEEMLSYAQDVADGAVQDDSFVSFVYSAPVTADPFDEATWRLANPDADSARVADIAALARQARRLPSLMPAFKAFHLNMPTGSDERFVSAEDWDTCAGDAEPSGPVFAALDLAGGASDLCAFALFWPEVKALRVWAIMPEGRIDASELKDRAHYRAWQAAGHIVACPGNAVDRAWLGNWMAQQTEGLELVSISADRWMLADLQQQLDREGLALPIAPHGQGFRDMSASVAAFERLVVDARLKHGANPLLRWSVGNASVEMDAAGNRKLSKVRSRGRIDPLVAAVMAIGTAERQPPAPTFEFTGLLLSG